MIYAHIAQEAGGEEEGRVLHGALLALAGEGELHGVGKDLAAKVAVLLLLDDEGVFKLLFGTLLWLA